MHFILRFFFYILIFCSTYAFAEKPTDSDHPANYRIDYGKSPYQVGELRVPAGKGPFPVAIIIHGGCWVSNHADLENTSALADQIRKLGVATWNIEYRPADVTGGGWPGTFQDVAKAADYLRKISSQYSLDLNRVIAIGHSAGGHLALWSAARPQLSAKSAVFTANPLKLKGVIVLGGVPDLKAFREQAIKQCEGDVIGKLIANSPTNYHDASPRQLLPLSVPQVLIYGEKDQVVPISFGDAYQRAALQKGDNVRVIEIADAEHHSYVQPYSVTWAATKANVIKLLHLKKV